jgi:hypothetical protein
VRRRLRDHRHLRRPAADRPDRDDLRPAAHHGHDIHDLDHDQHIVGHPQRLSLGRGLIGCELSPIVGIVRDRRRVLQRRDWIGLERR